MGKRPARILPVIVLSQFAGTSLWFAGNAVMADVQRDWALASDALGHVTSAVQLGFIAGTLVFAVLALADRYSPRTVFFLSSIVAAFANLGPLLVQGSLTELVICRFATGFFLAGIYPVGMKIAAGWYREGLGRALGFLVGALVLGTAVPHLLRALGETWSWRGVLVGTSLLAAAGGAAMLVFVPDGPHLARSAAFDIRALAKVFASRAFRASACGYFGHMWELYAFWAFVPVVLSVRAPGVNASLWSFAVIAAGAVGCIGGGIASQRRGSASVACFQLSASGMCCLASPIALVAPSAWVIAFLLFWGIVVVGDSPQFSALNAANAPREWIGSALTIANCIGFAVTIGSIQLLNAMAERVPVEWLFLLLAPGPVLGLLAMRPLFRSAGADEITGSRGSRP